eukprot:6894256-Alexandrium_andersonii.AAC.1
MAESSERKLETVGGGVTYCAVAQSPLRVRRRRRSAHAPCAGLNFPEHLQSGTEAPRATQLDGRARVGR